MAEKCIRQISRTNASTDKLSQYMLIVLIQVKHDYKTFLDSLLQVV